MSLLAELQRRNVFRVAVAYAALAWLLAQIADLVLRAFGAPDWMMAALLIMLAIGLPIALVISWYFELTPEGFRRDAADVPGETSTPRDHRLIDFAIIAVLVAAITFLLVDKFYIRDAIEQGNTAAKPSIAVLPFVNMSDDNDHFADGLSEELLNLLARHTDLKVAGRTSSFSFKGRNEDLREIGKALDVGHLLEGSVRRSGGRLRITAQLIKADDGFHVWSETYDRTMADVFDVQDDVAREITNALHVRLVPDANRPTDNVEAYALYLEALAMSDFPDGVIDEAIRLLDRAIELDPEFARAYLLKAMAYWQAAGWTIDMALGQRLVYRFATAAYDLDPGLVAARPFIVSANPGLFDWVAYLVALEAAIAAEPNNLRLIDTLSSTLLMTGYFTESLQQAKRFVEIDPLSPFGYLRVAFAESARGNRSVAREGWTRAAELGASEGYLWIACDHAAAAEYEEAIAANVEYFRAQGWNVGEARDMIVGATDPVNGKAYLDAWLARKSAEVAANGDSVNAIAVYHWYVVLGYLDDAWAVIERDREAHDTSWVNSENIEFSGVVLPLTGFRADPRFIDEALINVWESRGKPDMCAKIDGDWTCK